MEQPGIKAQAPPLSLGASLRANVTWTLLANIAYAACQWGMLVAFAKYGNAGMVGEFGLGLAITAPVFMFANLNLASVLATDAAGASAFGDYFGARVFTTAAAFLTCCAIALATHGTASTSAAIIAIAATKAIESLSDIFHGLFQRHETMDRIAKSILFRGASSLTAVALAVRAFGSVTAAAILVACLSAVVLFCFDLPNGAVLLGSLRRVAPRFTVRQLVAMIRVALPLGFVTMSIALTPNIPRYLLEHYGGTRDLGIFVGLAYVVTASSTVIGAIGRAAMPRLANLHTAGLTPAFKSLVRTLVLCGLAIGAAGVLVALVAGRPLLQLLYSAEYAAHAPAFAVVVLAGGIGHAASLLGYAVTAGRHFFGQIPLSIAVVVLTSIGSVLLIPRFGITGAAWALAVSAAVQLASYGFLYASCVNRPPHGAGT